MGARNSSVGPGTGAPSTTDSRRSTEAVASTGSAIAAAATGTPAAILESEGKEGLVLVPSGFVRDDRAAARRLVTVGLAGKRQGMR